MILRSPMHVILSKGVVKKIANFSQHRILSFQDLVSDEIGVHSIQTCQRMNKCPKTNT